MTNTDPNAFLGESARIRRRSVSGVKSVVVLLGIVATGALISPAEAQACTVCEGERLRLLAEPQGYPANGLIVTSVSGLEATVDGEPVELENVGIFWPTGDDVLRVEPAPTPGATVELTPPDDAVWCFGDAPEPGFIAGPPDVTAPLPPSKLTTHLHVIDAVENDGTCSDPPELVHWLHGSAPNDLSDPDRFLRVAVTLGDEVISLSHIAIAPGPFSVPVGLQDVELEGGGVTDVCLHVSTMDASGNESGTAVLCSPCHSRDDSESGGQLEVPPEPKWSDADLVQGGECDGVDAPVEEPEDTGGTSGTGGDETSGAAEGETSGGEGTGSSGETTGSPLPSTSEGPGPGPMSTSGDGGGPGQAVDGGCGCGTRRPEPAWFSLSLLVVAAVRRRGCS